MTTGTVCVWDVCTMAAGQTEVLLEKVWRKVDTMRIYFIRHGQSGNNASQQDDSVLFSARVADPHLTDTGKNQAEVAGKWLSQSLRTLYQENQHHQHYLPEAILTSPMMRALETADCLTKAFPTLPIVVLRDLCEIGGLFLGPRTPTASPRKEKETDSGKGNAASSDNPPTLSTTSDTATTGITLSALRARFQSVRIAQHIGQDGWWCGPRETHEEAVHRAWKFARQLWVYAAVHPHSSLIVVTHGLFQDLVLKTLICSTGPVPASRTSLSPAECLPFSGIHSAKHDIVLWPRLSLECPIATFVSDDPFDSYTDFHLLCNNVGVSSFELFASEPNPLPSSILSQKSSQQDTNNDQETSTDEVILKLGILYWNQSIFLDPELRKYSGQVVNGFSIF